MINTGKIKIVQIIRIWNVGFRGFPVFSIFNINSFWTPILKGHPYKFSPHLPG